MKPLNASELLHSYFTTANSTFVIEKKIIDNVLIILQNKKIPLGGKFYLAVNAKYLSNIKGRK